LQLNSNLQGIMMHRDATLTMWPKTGRISHKFPIISQVAYFELSGHNVFPWSHEKRNFLSLRSQQQLQVGTSRSTLPSGPCVQQPLCMMLWNLQVPADAKLVAASYVQEQNFKDYRWLSAAAAASQTQQHQAHSTRPCNFHIS
jgi:hypothetical protein